MVRREFLPAPSLWYRRKLHLGLIRPSATTFSHSCWYFRGTSEVIILSLYSCAKTNSAQKECNFQTFITDASSSFPVVLRLKSSICPSFPFSPLEWLLPRSVTSFSLKNLKVFSSSSSIMTFLLR